MKVRRACALVFLVLAGVAVHVGGCCLGNQHVALAPAVQQAPNHAREKPVTPARARLATPDSGVAASNPDGRILVEQPRRDEMARRKRVQEQHAHEQLPTGSFEQVLLGAF